jgi:hypothetical protein
VTRKRRLCPNSMAFSSRYGNSQLPNVSAATIFFDFCLCAVLARFVNGLCAPLLVCG